MYTGHIHHLVFDKHDRLPHRNFNRDRCFCRRFLVNWGRTSFTLITSHLYSSVCIKFDLNILTLQYCLRAIERPLRFQDLNANL